MRVRGRRGEGGAQRLARYMEYRAWVQGHLNEWGEKSRATTKTITVVLKRAKASAIKRSPAQSGD